MSTVAKVYREPSTITDVTVYESAAQVRRELTLTQVPAGEVHAVVVDLPAAFDRDSVQVAVRLPGNGAAGTGGCTLGGIAFKAEPIDATAVAAPSATADAAAAERAKLRARLESLTNELLDIRDEAAVARDAQDFSAKCLAGATGGISGRPEEAAAPTATAAWDAMVTNTVDRVAAAKRRVRAAERRVVEVESERAKLQAELSALPDDSAATRPGATRQVVIVALSVAAPLAALEVQVAYIVSGASWSAEYDVRVDAAADTATLTYNAAVKQSTGEAWVDVALTVSTARPSVSGKPKELEGGSLLRGFGEE
jgi:uncharacterized protein (TIGR02231 family)